MRVPLLFVAALAVLAVGKLLWLTVIDGPRLAAKAEANRTNTVTLQAKRGTIYDRNGNVLAMSAECRTLYCDPKQVSDAHAAAQVLAEQLGGTAQDYLSALTQDTTFVYLKKKVDTSVADEVVAALSKTGVTGVYELPDMKRVYPYGAVAGQILGVVGADGDGLTGLELQYNDILSGVDGERTMEMGRDGTPIAGGAYRETASQDGTDIVISLDIDVQEMAERQIVEGQETYKAESGHVIALDPSTGEILAACTTPLLDLTDTSEAATEALTLRSVTDSYEPGSVLKVVTTAVGIDSGSFTAETSFDVPASTQVGDDTVTDDDGRDYAMSMTPREIMRRSSNVGAVLMGRAIGTDAYQKGLASFGIGQATGIDYPGEVSGLVTAGPSFTVTNLGVMAFGQGLAIPTIQTARAVAAIANKGVLTTPHFLIYKGTEKVQWPEGTRACSPETAATVTDVMETVVTEGTAKNAAVDGYDVAAKTGTGEQADESGGYKSDSFLSSLVGFAPAKDPQVLVYVAFNGVPYHASVSAAPVFSAIMGEALLDMGVSPES